MTENHAKRAYHQHEVLHMKRGVEDVAPYGCRKAANHAKRVYHQHEVLHMKWGVEDVAPYKKAGSDVRIWRREQSPRPTGMVPISPKPEASISPRA